MVFLCGLINILITVTKVRKHIIRAIPQSLQQAISGGIGVFIAYIGLINAGLINFGAGVPSIPSLNTPGLWVFLVGLVLIIILSVLKIKGAILLSIIITALIGIPLGVTKMGQTVSFTEAAAQLPQTFAPSSQKPARLFSDLGRLPLVLITIFAFSLSDTFDTRHLIGTGGAGGIFPEDEQNMAQSRVLLKMDRALFADAIATSIGLWWAPATTTYVESAAGSAWAAAGLTSVVVALCFIGSASVRFVSAIRPPPRRRPW